MSKPKFTPVADRSRFGESAGVKMQKSAEIEKLKRENQLLRDEVSRLMKRGEPKIHYDIGGITACGLDPYEYDASDDPHDVTCYVCKNKWARMRKEYEKDER